MPAAGGHGDYVGHGTFFVGGYCHHDVLGHACTEGERYFDFSAHKTILHSDGGDFEGIVTGVLEGDRCAEHRGAEHIAEIDVGLLKFGNGYQTFTCNHGVEAHEGMCRCRVVGDNGDIVEGRVSTFMSAAAASVAVISTLSPGLTMP